MRLFVALEIPEEVQKSLAELVAQFRAIAPRAKWVRAENLHVTLKFIGEVAAEKIAPIRGALPKAQLDAPVKLDFRGLGFFPNEKNPRVFWAGISASPNLKTLASEIENVLEKLGIPRQQRPFSPHLTLARLESRKLPEKLPAAIQEHGGREFGAFEARQFHLIESKLKPSGAEYTTLQSFPFVAEA